MPIIQINMYKGRTLEKKRKLVKAVTDAVEESLGVKREDVRIILREMEKSDYAIAGKLTSDE